MSRPARYTIGQNNFTTQKGNVGTYYDKETGTYTINDPTDYHVITDKNKNRDIKGLTKKEIDDIPGNVVSDLVGIFTGEYNPMTALENIGARSG